MSIIAYFDTDKKAALAEEGLRKQGFTGKISIAKSNSKSVFYGIENQGERKEENNPLGTSIYGVNSGLGGSISLASTMTPRYGSMPNTISDLTRKLSKNQRRELKNIFEAGNTIMLVDDTGNKAEFIRSVLKANQAKLV